MNLRSFIYDRALLPLTAGWYQQVIERLEPGTPLLDVGIGTGGALARNAALVKARDLHVTGVDIDADYVKQAQTAMTAEGLSDRVDVRLESIYDHAGGPYGAAYFSASFMLMPDPVAALRHVMGLLGPNGRVFFTQTFQVERSPFMERLKPMLKRLTTVDFGTVTYEADFLDVVGKAGLAVEENAELGRSRGMSYRLVVGRPASGASAEA